MRLNMGNKKKNIYQDKFASPDKNYAPKHRKMKTLQNIIQEVILNGLNEGLP